MPRMMSHAAPNRGIRSSFGILALPFRRFLMIAFSSTFQQEVSSKKIIVEANRTLLSLTKDSGIVKGSK